MDSPFIYHKYVTGKNFLGRKRDVSILQNLLLQGENVALYSAARTGKTSLIQQAFLQLKLERRDFVTAEVDMMDVRDTGTFLRRMGDAVIRAFATTPSEYLDIVLRHLGGTHFIFDQNAFSEKDEILSLNWDMDEKDILALLNFPHNLARSRDRHVYIILKEFQNIMFADDSYQLLKSMESVMKEQKSLLEGSSCTYLMTGSQVNAMKDIFEHQRFFYRLVEKFSPGAIDEKEVTEYVVKGFLTSGKVIEKEKIMGACQLLKNHPWYVNHFFAICDHMAKGYVTDAILNDALDMLLSVHVPGFESKMRDLTTFQVSLLRAIADGNTRFSSAEVIQQYRLNSSANVKRLKDALMKKEIVTFDQNDDPQIIDPLFEYWVKKYFFKQKFELR